MIMASKTPTTSTKSKTTSKTKPSFTKKDIDDNRFLAALSYVSILCFLPLLLNRKSKYAQYHAQQGIAIFVVSVIMSVIGMFPIINILLSPVLFVVFIAVVLGSLYGILNAASGVAKPVPVFNKLAERFNF